METGRRGRHRRHFRRRISGFWRNKGWRGIFSTCELILDGASKVRPRWLVGAVSPGKENHRVFFHEDLLSSEELEETPA